MKKKTIRWELLLTLIPGALIMSAAFIVISYITFRDVEMKDRENYTRGLTGLIVRNIIRAEDKDETARLQADDSLQPWEKISAAVGITKYERGTHREPEEVLRKADEAMYADKLAMKAERKD